MEKKRRNFKNQTRNKAKSITLENDMHDVDIKEWSPLKKKKSKKQELPKQQWSQKDLEAL